MPRYLKIALFGIFLIGTVHIIHRHGRWLWYPIVAKVLGKKSVADIYQEYGQAAEQRYVHHFTSNNIAYPPASLTIIALKSERRLEVWTTDEGKPCKILEYPLTGFSGKLGPKLKAGDFQIPEGLYELTDLNPNSSYHLSIKVGYPNGFDLEKAKSEGRVDLGGDIFIHGKSVTIGCIPIGDKAIEELFTLVYRVGLEHCSVIIAPYDMRNKKLLIQDSDIPWLSEKYARIRNAIAAYDLGIIH
jgi:murein L,D-transpeptidase YafK